MKRWCCALLLAVLLPLAQAAAVEAEAGAPAQDKPAAKPKPANRVEREGFVFEAPAGWSMANNAVRSKFAQHHFFNAAGELIQLSVSGKMATEQYEAARGRLRAAESAAPRGGWEKLQSAVTELPGHGKVDESVFLDRDNELTSFAYNVYGPERIALFTITFKGIKPGAAESARALLGGLRWK